MNDMIYRLVEQKVLELLTRWITGKRASPELILAFLNAIQHLPMHPHAWHDANLPDTLVTLGSHDDPRVPPLANDILHKWRATKTGVVKGEGALLRRSQYVTYILLLLCYF
jgi:hypothetical protein